eukprot:14775225-Heterocapsa_arctica.AAC.2
MFIPERGRLPAHAHPQGLDRCSATLSSVTTTSVIVMRSWNTVACRRRDVCARVRLPTGEPVHKNSPEQGSRGARAVQALGASRRCRRRSLWKTAEIQNYEFYPAVWENNALKNNLVVWIWAAP